MGIFVEGVGDDRPAGEDEKDGGEGMAGDAEARLGVEDAALAAAEDEEAGGAEAEEEEVDWNHEVEDLLVLACECDQEGPDALHEDGDDGDAGSGGDVRNAFEEEAIVGHGEVDARGGENGLAEESECGEGDAEGDEPGSGFS